MTSKQIDTMVNIGMFTAQIIAVLLFYVANGNRWQ